MVNQFLFKKYICMYIPWFVFFFKTCLLCFCFILQLFLEPLGLLHTFRCDGSPALQLNISSVFFFRLKIGLFKELMCVLCSPQVIVFFFSVLLFCFCNLEGRKLKHFRTMIIRIVSTLVLNVSSVINSLQNCRCNNELSLDLYIDLS